MDFDDEETVVPREVSRSSQGKSNQTTSQSSPKKSNKASKASSTTSNKKSTSSTSDIQSYNVDFDDDIEIW